MEKRSVGLFNLWHESEQKFDYFMCGVAGALFAYLGERYVPRKLEFAPSALEPLALCFLVLAFFAGLKRIYYCNWVSKINIDQLHSAETAGHYTEVLAKAEGGGNFYNVQGGEIVTEGELAKKRSYHLGKIEFRDKELKKIAKRTSIAFQIRNWCLYLGFAALLLSKLLLPYAKP